MADQDSAATQGFSEQERAAITQRAAELKRDAKRGRGSTKEEKAAADEADVLDKIAQMPDPDRAMAERLHGVVAHAAPELAPKLYYGQPGYAREGKVLCFFRSGQMDGERYSTFGFSERAGLDDAGGLWPTAYALSGPTEEAWKEIAALIARAVGPVSPRP